MLIEAALAGLGAALLPEIFVEDELRTGKLVVVSNNAIDARDGYFLAISENRSTVPMVSKFCDWILSEARKIVPSHPLAKAKAE